MPAPTLAGVLTSVPVALLLVLYNIDPPTGVVLVTNAVKSTVLDGQILFGLELLTVGAMGVTGWVITIALADDADVQPLPFVAVTV